MPVLATRILWGFIFLLAGAVGVGVNYPPPVCAVEGSTVTLPCTFTPVPDGRGGFMKVIRVVWCQNHEICQGPTPSVYDSNSASNNPRYKYLGDLKGNCTLQITDVQQRDDATLRFRIESDDVKGHFTGRSGVKVTVTDGTPVAINSSSGDRQMRRGENITLFCTAPCTFHQLEVTWFRDGRALSESGPALQLSPLTAEDSGNYTCGVKTKPSMISPPYSLRVEAEDEAEDEGASENLPLIVGVVFGVLLALLTVIIVLCIIKRKRAADKDQRAVGGEVERKQPDTIYSSILPPGEPEGGRQDQETSRAEEDVNYSSVQFRHKNQARPVEEAEDGIIYSSVVCRA